jgi:hypothetical protein
MEVSRFKLSYCLKVVIRVVPLCTNTIFATSGELARRLTVQFDIGEFASFGRVIAEPTNRKAIVSSKETN